MKTLAIETSCDDTSLAIVSNDRGIFVVEKILAYSQIQEHQKFGWVVPELASRLHSEKIIAILQAIGFNEVQACDFISVTSQPGLPGSLVVGKTVAYTLGAFFGKKVLPVHHIHGHLFSILLDRKLEEITFPLVILTASGGHNDLYLIQEKNKKLVGVNDVFGRLDFANFEIYKIGQTLDDAAGECFDKVSRMLGGPYPWGAWISEQALKGGKNPLVQFKRIFLAHERYEFSFSGMKSQVSFLLEKLKKEGIELTPELICDIAYEFQESIAEVLSKKLIQAAQVYQAQTIALAGGVSANRRIKETIQDMLIKKQMQIPFLVPTTNLYSTDNGAMIGVAGILSEESLG